MKCNVLLSSAGRRVELLDLLRETARNLDIDPWVIALDAGDRTPAGTLADQLVRVPRADDPSYPAALEDIAKQHAPALLVPTIDPELPVLARMRPRLAELGVHTLISSAEAVRICGDKSTTAAHLAAHRVPHPRSLDGTAALEAADELGYPVIVKPRRGSSSVGVAEVADPRALRRSLRTDPDAWLVQSRCSGPEHTVDVWVDRTDEVRSVVARRRLAVRGGEVSQGRTEDRRDVCEVAAAAVQTLPGAYGPLTVQVMAGDAGPEVIEINARLGGGYPLAYAAGAQTLRWGMQDALGIPNDPPAFQPRAGVTMLRYDRSVFVEAPR